MLRGAAMRRLWDDPDRQPLMPVGRHNVVDARRLTLNVVRGQAFLRWHYPVQVQRSVTERSPSQPGSPKPPSLLEAMQLLIRFNQACPRSSMRERRSKERFAV